MFYCHHGDKHQSPCQEYQDKGEKVATSLLSHQPDAEYTVDNLCYKAARWYLRYNMPQKMFAAIRRLPNPSDQIDFFRSNGLVGEAAKCMSENGWLLIGLQCMSRRMCMVWN